MRNYFVAGIDTDSGKTLASAILCEALGADYWKPVQAGFPTDSEMIKSLVTNAKVTIHPEKFVLKNAMSPHAAAKLENIHIKIADFSLPTSSNSIVVEGAGGCLVPLNNSEFVIDMVGQLNLSVILVADLYLGSINHTLLTLEALKRREVDLRGIIFNGDRNIESEQIILEHSSCQCLLHINRESGLNEKVIQYYAQILKENWNE